jgi:hypothetical protein
VETQPKSLSVFTFRSSGRQVQIGPHAGFVSEDLAVTDFPDDLSPVERIELVNSMANKNNDAEQNRRWMLYGIAACNADIIRKGRARLRSDIQRVLYG